MNPVYRRLLHERRDLTEWLIHSTRKTDQGASPLDVLRTILIEGVIRPGFSYRNGNRTIYGPVPAVCFTEQPLADFATYAHVRPDFIYPYGVLVHKHDVYAAGGLPVIYGLDSPNTARPGHYNEPPGSRMLAAECLPIHEQYRYVTFLPTNNASNYTADWSHEREWRWPADAYHGDRDDFDNVPDDERLYYLGIAYKNHRGNFESRVHAFVKTDAEADWLSRELVAAHRRGTLAAGITFDGQPYAGDWRRAIQSVTIVSLEMMNRHSYVRFEDVEEHHQIRPFSF